MEHVQAKRTRERTQEERLKQNGGFGETHGVGDLLGLAVELVQHLAGLEIQALVRVVKADLLDRPPHHRLVVDLGAGCDLAKDHHEVVPVQVSQEKELAFD